MKPNTQPIAETAATLVQEGSKYELYFDLDGTYNARISEKWVKRQKNIQWYWGYMWGLIVGIIIVPAIKPLLEWMN